MTVAFDIFEMASMRTFSDPEQSMQSMERMAYDMGRVLAILIDYH